MEKVTKTAYEEIDENNEILNKRLIVFKLNDEILGVTLQFVKEVLKKTEIIKIPLLDSSIFGIFDLRGEIIPLINIKEILFGHDFIENLTDIDKRKIIIIKINGNLYGILVDEVLNIIEPDLEDYENIPNSITSQLSLDYIEDFIFYEENIIKVINIPEIMGRNFQLTIENDMKKVNSDNRNQSPNSPIKTIKNQHGFKLDHEQKDALKEICNIASGNAIVALSELFSKKTKINMTIDDLIIKKLSEFSNNSGIELSENVVGIKAKLRNDLDGSIFLMFPTSDFLKLLKELENVGKIPKNLTSIKNLTKSLQSTVLEIGNIIISHYCSGISDFLNIRVYHEVPQIAIDEYGALIDSEMASLAQYSNQGVLLQTKIDIKKQLINGQIIFIPYHNSMEKFIDLMDVERIVRTISYKTDEKTNERTENEIFSKVAAQTEFKIEKTLSKDLKIKDEDLDAFRELGNIGAGNAGNALSQLLNKKVYLEIPPAKVLDLPDLSKTYKGNKISIGYVGTTKGLFESNLLLLFSKNHIENLLSLIMEPFNKKLKSESDLNVNEKSAVVEVLNILMGHYIAAMGNFLDTLIEPPEYLFIFKRTNELFKQLDISPENEKVKAIVIETSIKVDETKAIKGDFILLLHPKVVHRILNRIREIW